MVETWLPVTGLTTEREIICKMLNLRIFKGRSGTFI